MKKDENIAPALRWTAFVVLMAISIPLMLITKQMAKHEPVPGILAMSLIAGITIGLLVALFSERSKNAVVKLPKLPSFKRKDTFVS